VDDDEALLRRLRAGEEEAFEALIARYDASLRRVARTFVRTPSAADEVAQETWLGVLKGLHGFEGRSSLRTWIFMILANRARTRAVRDARTVPFSALEDDDRAAVDPSAFGDDGRWRSTPKRLEVDPQGKLVAWEPFHKVNEAELLRARIRQALGEISAAEAQGALAPARATMPGDDPRDVARRDVKLGLMLLEKKSFAQAEKSAERALSRDPESAAAHALLGRALAATGRCAKAVPELDRALAAAPGDEAAQAARKACSP